MKSLRLNKLNEDSFKAITVDDFQSLPFDASTEYRKVYTPIQGHGNMFGDAGTGVILKISAGKIEPIGLITHSSNIARGENGATGGMAQFKPFKSYGDSEFVLSVTGNTAADRAAAGAIGAVLVWLKDEVKDAIAYTEV